MGMDLGYDSTSAITTRGYLPRAPMDRVRVELRIPDKSVRIHALGRVLAAGGIFLRHHSERHGDWITIDFHRIDRHVRRSDERRVRHICGHHILWDKDQRPILRGDGTAADHVIRLHDFGVSNHHHHDVHQRGEDRLCLHAALTWTRAEMGRNFLPIELVFPTTPTCCMCLLGNSVA